MQTPGPQAAPQMPNLAYTFTDTHMILGLESTVEKAIRTLTSSGASLSSAKWFSKAKSLIPSVVGTAMMADLSISGELSWWMLKESGKQKGPLAGLFRNSNIYQLINTELLPEFDAVKKYFGMETIYGISRPDGFYFELNYSNNLPK